MNPHTIVIFASGAGTNARKIVDYFRGHPNIRISAIFSNKAEAGVKEVAAEAGIPFVPFTREALENQSVLEQLQAIGAEWIVLAGFLWKMPDSIVQAYPQRIINIHPALLPKFGGKGMYGMHVHRAVKEAGEAETGMTIHFVNEHYDEGTVIHQEKVKILPEDTGESIAGKVQKLEHEWYPRIIERLVLQD
jgi:phosphoribosylglycinamide formyltransferase-1